MANFKKIKQEQREINRFIKRLNRELCRLLETDIFYVKQVNRTMRDGVLTIVEFSVNDAEAKTAFCTFPIVICNSNYKDSIICAVANAIFNSGYIDWSVDYVDWKVDYV